MPTAAGGEDRGRGFDRTRLIIKSNEAIFSEARVVPKKHAFGQIRNWTSANLTMFQVVLLMVMTTRNSDRVKF